MNRLASPAQLRASLMRWSLFLVPAVLLLGFMSGQLAGSGGDNPWFAQLTKPGTFPPPAAFGIVWSILYVLMGLAAAGVCSAFGSRFRTAAVIAFVVQLCLNLLWSPMFFLWHNIAGALVVIALLDLAVLVTIYLFFQVRRWAGLLLLPYLAWILFATLLNFQFLQQNPDASNDAPNNAVQRIEMR
ncbi:tryptophan-rich sensory protein [Aurantiacibacter xanthus]|uniref:Tryptophan-rich sensory protein n=1 Tax=Aurantiacibacter xanthus TaxID=1784712 RepID=A0A3A1PIG7_9SPHN|nr:TspO/MBR family protein [Aurantiacibacter xanthus]RIV93401.1 tryptophan-rich sensory protein [Aurantiacibacter xanthus]